MDTLEPILEESEINAVFSIPFFTLLSFKSKKFFTILKKLFLGLLTAIIVLLILFNSILSETTIKSDLVFSNRFNLESLFKKEINDFFPGTKSNAPLIWISAFPYSLPLTKFAIFSDVIKLAIQ